MHTTRGVVDISLLDQEVPLTTQNFLRYVESKSYDGSVIHRAPKDVLIQGGGYRVQNNTLVAIPKLRPVNLEYSSARPNVFGSIAMARAGGPNSATSEWFINTADNSTRFGENNDGGYAVFGRVTQPGMVGVLGIGALPIVNAGAAFSELPVLVSRSGAIEAGDLIYVTSATRLPNPPSNADRAFNFLEATYWQVLKPPGGLSATGAAGGTNYYFRYYPASNSYIGVSIPGNEVFYLVPEVGPALTRFSTLADLMPTVTAAGY